MPIYEYRCEACGAEFEMLVLGRSGNSAGPAGETVTCQACAGGTVTRKPSRFGFGASAARAVGAEPASSLPVVSAGGCCGGTCGCRRSQ